MADCELHAFVDADPQKNVQRLYWVQFEGYLPTRPELKHNYDSPRHANIGGMDFYLLGCPTTGNSTVLSVRSSSSYDTRVQDWGRGDQDFYWVLKTKAALLHDRRLCMA